MDAAPPLSPDSSPFPPDPEEIRNSGVLVLGESCGYDARHALQVCRLSLMLFQHLHRWHRLDDGWRRHLIHSSLLHDVARPEGRRGHHKRAQRIILETPLIAWNPTQRRIVACIARYHRKALPDPVHEVYDLLSPSDRHAVAVLSGLLRLADALERSRDGRIEQIFCRLNPNILEVICRSRQPLDRENSAFIKKSDLLGRILGRRIVMKVEKTESPEGPLWSSRLPPAAKGPQGFQSQTSLPQ